VKKRLVNSGPLDELGKSAMREKDMEEVAGTLLRGEKVRAGG